MPTNNILEYPVSDMIRKMMESGHKGHSIMGKLYSFVINGSEGSVVTEFMKLLKEAGNEELDDYVQVWPLTQNKSVLFANKGYLLSIVEADPVHLDKVLNDIAFRYEAGKFTSPINQTLVASFSNRLFQSVWVQKVAGILNFVNAKTVYALDVNTIEDLSNCDYQEYFSTAIAWPITDVIEAAFGSINSEGFTYVATIDFIVESLIKRHNDVFLRKCENVRDIIDATYANQISGNLAAKVNMDVKPDVVVDEVKSRSFTLQDLEYDQSSNSPLFKFTRLGDKEEHHGLDVLILHIPELTPEMSELLDMFDFNVDSTDNKRYKMYRNRIQKMFIVVIDG